MPSARPSGAGAAGSARSTRPTSAPTRSARSMDRTGIDPGAVEDVMFGCVDTVGGQAGDIARTCWLAAGLPEHVPGTTVDRQCGSAQQAVHFAAQAVMAGVNDVVVAGGVQQMSMIPISSAMTLAGRPRLRRPVHRLRGLGEALRRRRGEPVPRRRDDRREVGHLPRGHGGLRGRVATSGPSGPRAEGRFEAEIAPLDGLDHDEGPREPNWEKIRSLPTLRRGRPRHRRGVVADLRRVGGAARSCSEQALKDHGLTPRARIHHMSVRADDPICMLTAPIPATRYALREDRA